MKISEIVDLARRKSKTNTTTFSDRDMLLYFKAKVPQFQADIEKVNEDYMGSIDVRDLRVTGEGTYVDEGETYPSREYNLPVDLIPRIKFVQAKLDGINWLRLEEYDINDIKIPFKEEYIKETFNNTSGVAGYTIFRGSLFLLCGEIEEAVVGGLELFGYSYSELPDARVVANSSDDVDLELYGIPKSMHELLATALCIEYKSNLETPVQTTQDEQLFPITYTEKLKSLRKLNRGKEISFSRPEDGFDGGFNL
jgi:hypothetical protein